MAAEFLKVLNFKDKREDVDVKLAKVNTIDNTRIKTQLAEVFYNVKKWSRQKVRQRNSVM